MQKSRSLLDTSAGLSVRETSNGYDITAKNKIKAERELFSTPLIHANYAWWQAPVWASACHFCYWFTHSSMTISPARAAIPLILPTHGIVSFQFLPHAFGLLHLLLHPLMPLLSLRLEVAQVGRLLVREEHLHIGVGSMLLEESPMQVRSSAQGGTVLLVREIRKIAVAMQGVMDAVFQHVLAQFTDGFCSPC